MEIKREGLVLVFLVLILTFSGCIKFDTVTPAEKAAEAIDNMLATSNFQSDQWRAEVEKLGIKLETIESNAAQDVKDIAVKTIATGGQEMRCDADFLRTRTKQDLQRLADKLRGKPTTPPLPTLCIPPDGVNMNSRPDFLEYYGYDFKLRERDPKNPARYIETKRVRGFLVYDGGEIELSDTLMDINTHYKLTMKTSEDKNPICNKENRHIILRSIDGVEISSVGVAKKTCPTAPSTPPPYPEKSFGFTRFSLWSGSADPGDKAQTQEFGGSCEAGYHRTRYLLTEEDKNKNSGCTFLGWTSNDEKMCKVKILLAAEKWGGAITCKIQIWNEGDIQPAPPTPACPCW